VAFGVEEGGDLLLGRIGRSNYFYGFRGNDEALAFSA
jgi:hypothetical protein